MKAKKKTNAQYVWAIYFVGFDDTNDDPESRVEPYVGKERVAASSDPNDAWEEVHMAVLMRGGSLLAVMPDDELQAESIRSASEAEILRKR
jgi:hypothetical protein